MSQINFYNVVQFVPNAGSTPSVQGPIALTLDRPWKLSAGLKPDINQATMPVTEFLKIGDVNAGGSIQFYFTSNPSGSGAPDFITENVRIVDIEPLNLATYQATDSASTSPSWGFTEYRLSFADFREAFVAPRGGRLQVGPINVGNVPINPPTGSAPANASPELTISQLATLCLQAMGLTIPAGGLPSTLDSANAPRNLKWFGNHAPTELEKLLTLAGHVFCPHVDGTYTIEQMTASGNPSFGTSGSTPTLIAPGSAPKIDQRGRYVVIGSWPTRAINTETITGPATGQFDYVVWSTSGKWQTLVEYFGDLPTAAQIFQAWVNGGFQGLTAAGSFPAAQLDPAVVSQVFSFVRISSAIAQHFVSPILDRRFEADGSTPPIQILANAAAKTTVGSWYMPSGQQIAFQATHRLDGNVLALNAPAFKVDSDANFVALGSSDMTIRFSIEQFSPAQDGAVTGSSPMPYYYTSGWSAGAGGGPTQMSEDDTASAVSGQTKGVLIIARPELQLLIVDGQTVNQSQLDTAAETIAGQYLKPANQQLTTQSCVGFAYCNPSGLITSVEWDQKAVMTTARCNDWYTAASAVGIHNIRKLEGGNGSGQSASEAHPHESATQSDRSSMGASGDSARTLPLIPSPGFPGGIGGAWGWSTGNINNIGGAYNGFVCNNLRQAITIGAGFIQIAFTSGVGSGAQAGGTPCVILVPAENDSTVASLPTNVLIGLTPMPAMPAVSAALGVAANVPIYLAQWDPTAIRNVSYDPTGHYLNDSVFSSPTTPQLKHVVQFVDCQTGT